MGTMKITAPLYLVGVTLLFLTAQSSAALASGQAIRVAANSTDASKIREQAVKIKEMKALLSDPDQTVRLSALDAMLKSDSAPMREVAFEYAFSSPDYAMRALGLRERIRNSKVLLVEPSDQGEPLKLEVLNFDEKNGSLEIRYGHGPGQISGLKLSFEVSSCIGHFQLEDEAVMKGTLACRSQNNKRQMATIKLQ